MTPSPQQSAFYSALTSTSDSLFLCASAGSGKTTTLVAGARLLPLGQKVVVFAFNKDIAEELRSRLPFTVETATFHSYAFAALRQHFRKMSPKPDPKKCVWILKELVPEWKERRKVEAATLALVSYAKNAGFDLPGVSDVTLQGLFDRFNLDAEDPAEVLRLAADVLLRSNANTAVADFDDMLYLPLVHNIPMPRVGAAFVDEAQDTNRVQRLLLHKMLGTSPQGEPIPLFSDGSPIFPQRVPPVDVVSGRQPGRLIAVGDPNQAIYGFRGADSDATASLVREFNMKVLPLSVSYRCSKAVVREAQRALSEEF